MPHSTDRHWLKPGSRDISVEIECRVGSIAHAIRDLSELVCVERVQKDGFELIIEVALIRDPLGIGRPDLAELDPKVP